MRNLNFLWILLLALAACTGRNNKSDAYGNFETVEYLISAEGQGKILELSILEGDRLESGQVLGFIDTTSLVLQRDQLLAKKRTIDARRIGISTQTAVLETQKKNLLIEAERLEKLLKAEAATGKQMDNLQGQLRTLERQIAASKSGYVAIDREIQAVETQIKSLDDQINKNSIINPVNGTVLEKYSELHEMAMPGKVLYKIADLEKMILRAYISGEQLSGVQIGQTVLVIIDDEENPEITGRISWISDKSEFTPKIIQTREERVNLVYAIKVEVPNDGRLKIGMPGEVIFSNEGNSTL
jgi:HlyD family secretion protein